VSGSRGLGRHGGNERGDGERVRSDEILRHGAWQQLVGGSHLRDAGGGRTTELWLCCSAASGSSCRPSTRKHVYMSLVPHLYIHSAARREPQVHIVSSESNHFTRNLQLQHTTIPIICKINHKIYRSFDGLVHGEGRRRVITPRP
jgi:hypothetical protein